MRAVHLGLTLATVIAALALFHGMITAGLVPLAVFGPAYALARTTAGADRARSRAARVTVAASAALGLALVPALRQAAFPQPAWASIGLTVTAAGAGALAGFAAADHGSTASSRQRWSFVNAMEHRHARGLALLAGVAVLAGTLVALLREAPIARLGDASRTLPGAVFGDLAVDGALVLPGPTSTLAIALPLSLAPLALGFLTSPKRSAPLAAGGAAVLALAPLVVWLDVPARASTGAWVPVSVIETPGLAVPRALAPSTMGLLVAGGAVHAVRRGELDPRASQAAWALGAALLSALLWGLLPGLVVGLGVLAAAGLAALATDRAAFGLAVLLGGLAGWAAQLLLDVPASWTVGVFVATSAGGAAGMLAACRAVDVPGEGLRSPWTLVYALAGLLGVGAVLATTSAGAGSLAPFPAPHARALEAALAALLDGRGLLLLLWGLIVGGLLEWLVGRAAWVALGGLAGPGIAALVLAGSLLRALWEKGLLERASEGYVMRGQLGYELLRVHVLVAGVLAGEALALTIAHTLP
jgi:hypothetical protein